jgi:hypothetical protein
VLDLFEMIHDRILYRSQKKEYNAPFQPDHNYIFQLLRSYLILRSILEFQNFFYLAQKRLPS